jgi:WD40 repeat protein
VVSASGDGTLKVWNLTTGQLLATLQGHTALVTACAVMPDGERVVSASEDRTLKVWDLASHTCLFTHRANAAYTAVDATATSIIAGDDIGSIWFLDLPPPYRSTSDLDRFVRTDTISSQVPAEQADRSSQLTREVPMTPPDFLNRLARLLPSQFEEVLFRTSVPVAHLPGEGSPQTTRAIAVIRYLEQQKRLDQLARILDEVAGPS